jgi:aminopeptidase
MNDIYVKYADLLVNYSLRLKSGDKFIIKSTYLAEPLVKEVYRAALQIGAHPEMFMSFNSQQKIYFDFAGDQQLKYVSPLLELVVNQYDAYLNILSPFNMKELQNVDAQKQQTYNIAHTEIKKIWIQRAAEGSLNWTLCVYPGDAAAQECDMSLEEYQRFVYGACFLYEDDPIAKWKQFSSEQQRIVDYLNTKQRIHYNGPDIDLKFSCKGRKWINSDGKKNMPSGEVFTTPVEDSVNGKVRFSFPGFFMGKEIEDIQLEVKDGQVVKWNAAKGKDILDKMMDIPGARTFGEAAIGTNKGIDKFTKNMLFDEKIGGTIHMAVGSAIKETGGTNESAIHWDMLADMRNGGQIFADDELIYENGKFII